MIPTSWLIVGAIGIFGLVVLALVIRARSEDALQSEAPPVRKRQRQPSMQELFPEPPNLTRSVRNKVAEKVAVEGFSSQLQTASDNLRIEVVGGAVRYIVNGIAYDQIEHISEPELRNLAEQLRQKTLRGGHPGQLPNEEIRQVQLGNQKTIEARSLDYTVSVQEEAGQKRYVVNGRTYYALNDINEPELRNKAQELLKKRL